MIIELKGFVEEVTPVVRKESAGKTTLVQALIVKVPGYTDQFGDKKGEDKLWQFTLFNEAIKKNALAENVFAGQKVRVEGYLDSKTYNSGGETKFALNLNLRFVEILP